MRSEKQELLRKLEEWQADAYSATPTWACRHFGLCRYAVMASGSYQLARLLKKYFPDSNEPYPFGEGNYHERAEELTQHLDPARRAFVAETIATLRAELGE